MNVIGYTRVSTDGQCADDKFGLDVQKKQIREYCEENNLTIVMWECDEGESGAKERPGFDDLVFGDVSDLEVGAVVVAKSDRVARDINVYYYYKMLLLKKNIKLISISEDFGKYGVFSNMLEAFTLCVAELERDNITKRTSSGRKVKASRGGYAGGRAPLGYKIENGKLVVNEAEAEVVKKIFQLRDENMALRTICDVLNKSGCVTRSGKPYVVSTVQSVVNNRKTYEGYYHYGNNGEWVKGQHEAILEENEVQ